MKKQKPTLGGIAKNAAINTGRRMIGLPAQSGYSVQDWFGYRAVKLWANISGSGPKIEKLPADMPVKLYQAIDQTLRLRGGTTGDAPNFWCNPRGCTSTLFLWAIRVEYQPSADPAKLASMESALESAIDRAGFNYNVRIKQRAVVVEIDKPNPPKITLKDCWPHVEAQAINERQSIMGAFTLNGKTAYGFERLVDQDCSAFITGKPRSGKSQAGMSLILSLAMTNSPESLSMIIVDPKLIDFRPFSALPHLAAPIISDPAQAAAAILMLSDEIDQRRAMVARGDKSFLKHSILIYVDEMTDLFDSLEKHTDAKPNPVVVAWRRLAMVGGGLNILAIGCTQRVYDLHIDVYSKLGLRLTGKQGSAGDSAAATGRAGTTAHLLPGRGSFELYSGSEDGTRVQGTFVADSKDPNYEKDLDFFFDSINARWKGHKAGWNPPQAANSNERDNPSPLPTETPKGAQSKPEAKGASPVTDQAFLDAMNAAYGMLGEKFSTRTVRDIHKRLYGKEPENAKAQRLKEQFLSNHATDFALNLNR